MPHPSAQELYNVAERLSEVDGGLVRAAADELVERRKAMRLAEAEIERLRVVNSLNEKLIREQMKTQVALLQAAEREGR